jgi:AcrR family transcriptional regulator
MGETALEITQLGEPIQTTSRRGRPRSEKARRAILQAAADLLFDQGGGHVSMDAVADRAGVSKATIYRWWPSKERLTLEALLEWASAGCPPSDTGSLHGDLLALVRPLVRDIGRREFGRVIASLISEAQSDPGLAAEYHRHYLEPRREPMQAAFARAIDRGEARADLDIDVAIELVYGSLYHRLLQVHAPLTDRFAQQVVDLVVNGILRRDRDRGS